MLLINKEINFEIYRRKIVNQINFEEKLLINKEIKFKIYRRKIDY